MNLYLLTGVANHYRSPSQITRVMTESWALSNLYCPVCDSSRIEQTRTNTAVVDFLCPKCSSIFQLKAKRNSLGRKIVDAAYDAMIRAILNDTFPHLFILSYMFPISKVNNLVLVPNFCLPISAIEARKPLSKAARRAGWEGCNILLDLIPPDGRIDIVSSEKVIPKSTVRRKFHSAKPLKDLSTKKRGWTLDVLTLVRSLRKSTFTLREAYSFEKTLSRMHPENRNIRPKIRQQLQILRDLGYLAFLGNGIYRWKR